MSNKFNSNSLLAPHQLTKIKKRFSSIARETEEEKKHFLEGKRAAISFTTNEHGNETCQTSGLSHPPKVHYVYYKGESSEISKGRFGHKDYNHSRNMSSLDNVDILIEKSDSGSANAVVRIGDNKFEHFVNGKEGNSNILAYCDDEESSIFFQSKVRDGIQNNSLLVVSDHATSSFIKDMVETVAESNEIALSDASTTKTTTASIDVSDYRVLDSDSLSKHNTALDDIPPWEDEADDE
jgi:hypothetical protein